MHWITHTCAKTQDPQQAQIQNLEVQSCLPIAVREWKTTRNLNNYEENKFVNRNKLVYMKNFQ